MTTQHTLRHLLLTTLIATAPTLVLAQSTEVTDLDAIIISGGLTGVSKAAFTRAFSEITADDIAARGITTVQDALRALPGVAVSSTGVTYTQVRIRGGEGSHTLILIDGIEASGGAGEYILTGLETANIERIEVLRGPQSVYYGSNASAGVINIITKKGGLGTHYGGSLELGNGWSASANASQRTERGGLSLSLSKRDDLGFDQSGDGGEKDGINRETLNLAGDWNATDNLTLGFTLRRSKERYEFDSTNYSATDAASYIADDTAPFSNRDETTGAAWAEYSLLSGRLVQHLEYQDSIFKQGNYGGAMTRGESEKLKYRMSFGLDGHAVEDSDHLLNLLIEHQRDHSSAAADYLRKRDSVALEYRGSFAAGIDIQAGVRRDENSVFSGFTSWNLGAGYRIPDTGVRLHASAGTGLVNPSYYQLFANESSTFYGTTYTTQGNTNLKPETNRGYDIGIEADVFGGRGVLDVTYFNQTLEDEIEYYEVSSTPSSVVSSYRNQAGKSPREGVEIKGQLQATDNLGFTLNYTYLNAKNPNGSVEIRRPKHELGLSATLDFADKRGSVTADIRHVAGNWDTQFWGYYPTVKLPDYTTVNLSTTYELTDNVRLAGRVVNLFDKSYSDVWGFASQGRTVYAGISTQW